MGPAFISDRRIVRITVIFVQVAVVVAVADIDTVAVLIDTVAHHLDGCVVSGGGA